MQKPTQKLFIVLLGNLLDVLTASISMKDKRNVDITLHLLLVIKKKEVQIRKYNGFKKIEFKNLFWPVQHFRWGNRKVTYLYMIIRKPTTKICEKSVLEYSCSPLNCQYYQTYQNNILEMQKTITNIIHSSSENNCFMF